jgi:DNA-binding GntR family transcriptional regulator
MKTTAYQYILQKMTRGELEPGMQISELSIAAELGISRSPVRDALSQMVTEGMVERVPRFGTVIKKLSTRELSDLYGLRVALEGYAAELVAENVSDTDLSEMEDACEGIRNISVDLKKSQAKQMTPEMLAEMSRLDMKFHLVILKATRNRMLLKSAHDTRQMVRIFGIRRVENFDYEYVNGVYQYHRGIFEAIRDRDPQKARQLMTEHINFSRDGALKFISEHQQQQHKDDFDQMAESLILASQET